jgi:hypothetical protein
MSIEFYFDIRAIGRLYNAIADGIIKNVDYF